MTSKLAITGPFADVNLGDYAMLINNIALIEPTELVIFTYDNDFSSQLVDDYCGQSIVDVCVVAIDDDNAARITANSMPHEIISSVSNVEEILKKLQSMGKLLVNGGGYFNSLWFKPHRRGRLCQIIAPILIASAYGIPVVFSGNGYGPFEDKDIPFFERIFAFLKKAAFGSRDSYLSPVWASKVGIGRSQMTFIPDDLFPVQPRLLKGHASFVIPDTKYCVLETYYSVEYLETNKSQFINFFRFVQDELKLRVILLPFHLENGGLTQSRLIQSWDERIDVIDISDRGYLPIIDAMSIISNSEFVISSRYHALVFAVQSKTPIFSVMRDVLNSKAYYFNKNYGFLETALGRNFDPNVFLYDCYTSAFDAIMSALQKQLDYQHSLFDNFLDKGIISAETARIGFFEREIMTL